jgi:hypothetical protein
MIIKSFLRKTAPLGLIFLFAIVFSPNITNAQTASSPQFLITWKTAGSYIPSFYEGKALPTYGSQITASVELISQGKILDLSNQTVYWYLNDTLIGGGVGVQTVTFPPLGEPPSSLQLKVELPYYSAGYLINTINIPMVKPQAVISAPYPDGQFSQNTVTLTALPYFFNTSAASNLSYTWSVNGQQGSNTENPEEAQITLPKGTSSGEALSVSLSIKNPSDSTIGTASQNLTYESQL